MEYCPVERYRGLGESVCSLPRSRVTRVASTPAPGRTWSRPRKEGATTAAFPSSSRLKKTQASDHGCWRWRCLRTAQTSAQPPLGGRGSVASGREARKLRRSCGALRTAGILGGRAGLQLRRGDLGWRAARRSESEDHGVTAFARPSLRRRNARCRRPAAGRHRPAGPIIQEPIADLDNRKVRSSICLAGTLKG